MKRALWIVAVLALAAGPTLAQGDDTSDVEAERVTGQLEHFDAINRNGDEFLDWEEIRNQVAKIFYESDADGDGSLVRDEFGFSDDHWKLSDVNENGRVELSELTAHAAIIFGHADLDGDDRLSREEATAARAKEGLN